MEIDQITPEQEAQFGAMDVAQLEAHVASEEGAAPQAEATGQPQAAEATQQTQAPQEEAPPKWFQDYVSKSEQNLKRELGSLRSLQGMGDKLPQLVQQQITAQLAQIRQAQQTANLSPEDQQAQAQLQTQQDQLAKYIRDQSRQEFGEAAKTYIPVLDKLIEREQRENLETASFNLVEGLIPDKAAQKEAWDEVFKQSYEDLVANKPGSVETQQRLENDPAFLAIRLAQVQRGKVQAQSNQVIQQRTNAGRQAAQGPRNTGTAQGGKKSIADMTPAEMQAYADKDPAAFEAEIPEM